MALGVALSCPCIPDVYMADSVGSRIREARERAGMTQVALADAVGVRQPTMWRYEHDQVQPGAKKLHLIAGVLGVPASWLLFGRTDEERQPGDPDPPFWSQFLEHYPRRAELDDGDLAAMKSFGARAHRIRSWADWAQLADWYLNRRPSKIFEEANRGGDE